MTSKILPIFIFSFLLLANLAPAAHALVIQYDFTVEMGSGSMHPTVKLNDTVYVKNATGGAVNASYVNGDIILFNQPGSPVPNMIIHRAVEKFYNISGDYYYFKTKGDYNLNIDPWNLTESDLIGKVVAFLRSELVDGYEVDVFSNSAYLNLHYNATLNALEFNVTMLLTQSALTSFFNITIPNELVTGPIDVLVNGSSTSFQSTSDATWHYVWFDAGTNYIADIIVPEFSEIALVASLIIMMAVVVFLKRRAS